MKTILFQLLLFVTFIGYSQRPIAKDNGKFLNINGTRMLYGGDAIDQHFIIDDLDLMEKQFHYGLGRERFPALLHPKFETVITAKYKWKNSDRFMVAHKGNDIKAYSIEDLTRHEVVNDVIDGEPIFAAYCILADLGAIYKRTYGDIVFTFAVSGYTYYDPKVWDGLDGFVLWDRETESLWWPLIDEAVSGALKGVKLRKLEEIYWEIKTWEMVRTKYPTAKVLISGQDFKRPKNWEKIKDVTEIVKKYSD